MLFGVVSGVGRGMCALDGVPHAPRGKGGFGFFSVLINLNDMFWEQKYIRPLCGKLTIFPYIAKKDCSVAFPRSSQVRDQSWSLQEICTNVTVISCKNRAKQQPIT